MSPEPARLDATAIGLVSLVVVEGVKLFHDLAPDVAELRRNGGDPAVTADLRAAEMLTAGVVILAGLSLSYVSGSNIPAYLSVASVVLLIGVGEWTNAKAPATNGG